MHFLLWSKEGFGRVASVLLQYCGENPHLDQEDLKKCMRFAEPKVLLLRAIHS